MINKTPIKTTRDFCQERVSAGQKIGVINLGCARNLIDSQAILGTLKRRGHHIVDLNDSDVAVVNTCAFIDEAKKESIETIVDLLEMKKKGQLKKVIVAGCLAQRYGEELFNELTGIDAIIGTQKLDQNSVPSGLSLTPNHFAYVKICESCYNRCSFCIIPKIKGKFVSRTMESIISEVEALDAKGVKEINIIGQDITAYGMDLYHDLSLAKLLRRISAVCRNIEWIRLLYTFPAHVTDELIEVMAGEEKICQYIDMPLQHISDHLLASMKRNMTTKQTMDLLSRLRSRMPEASLRTTFIVGLPGETENDFDELLEFIKVQQFEKVGVFIYSREEGTSAYDMTGQVPDSIKKQRLNALMKVQQEISKSLLEKRIGKTLKVMIEEKSQEENGLYLGRTQFDAPEVDGIVYVHTQKQLNPGKIVEAKIQDAYEYDLVGEV